jgi:hypothetical protein
MELVSSEDRLRREHPVDPCGSFRMKATEAWMGFFVRATSLSKNALTCGSCRIATSAGMNSPRRIQALPSCKMRAGLSAEAPD